MFNLLAAIVHGNKTAINDGVAEPPPFTRATGLA